MDKVKILVCLALIVFTINCVSALELEYKQAPARQDTIKIWDEGNGYYLFDIYGVSRLRMTGFDAAEIFLQALGKFENDHPDLNVVSTKPFTYDNGGSSLYYYVKCVPKV